VIALATQALALTGLATGLWLAVALWATLRARRLSALAAASLGSGARAEALLAAGPAMPLMVAPNGAIEAGGRLAGALGFEAPPPTLEALLEGLELADAAALRHDIAAAGGAGGRFVRALRPVGATRILRIEGMPAPPPCAPGTALLWFFDATESEEESEVLSARLERHGAALDALSALIEAAPFPIWHRGPDGRLTMVNGAYVDAVEAEDASEVVAEGIELVDDPLTPAPDAPGAAAAQRTVPATIAGERRMMRVAEVSLAPGGIAGFAIDVDDQEQAHADLTRFVRAQRDMLDRLSAGVAQFARDRSLIFFNQPFARMFSLTGDFLADRPEFDQVIEAMREQANLPEVRDFPDWKEERRRWFTSGLAADEEDWLLPGGKHLRVVAQPLPDGGLLLIFEDRTEQIQLASARDTLLRVRAATFDNLFEAIGVFASDGRLQLWNNRFRLLWDLDEEQLAQHPRVDTLTPHLSKKLRNPNHAGLVRELVRSATVERKQRSGRVNLTDGREFEFAAVPLPDGNALFTMLDITDSRKVEAALRERNEALEDADRLKTAFVSNMSYELRTPLTSIGGFAEMLAGGYAGDLSPTAGEYVSAILDSVARLSLLIDNVLDLTQSDMGSLLLAEEEVDLAVLCRAAAADFAKDAEAKSIDFALDIDDSAGTVTGDRTRLRQALDNILGNAFAYTGASGRILLHAEGTAKGAAITVSDNGRGIAFADQTRVFDRFHRTAEGEGEQAALGLGLPLARQFVEAHGGAIELQSEPGEGTTVVIRLPRTAAQREAFEA
jgi:signal transduction histidine kinase